MSIAEIRGLPVAEKRQIMEILWEDLRSHVEPEPVPQWHKDILDDRRKKVAEGREEILDWDEVKNSIGQRC